MLKADMLADLAMAARAQPGKLNRAAPLVAWHTSGPPNAKMLFVPTATVRHRRSIEERRTKIAAIHQIAESVS